MVETFRTRAARINALLVALGTVLAVAACAAPPAVPTSSDSPSNPTPVAGRILAVRPLSAAGSGTVSGVLAVIGVGTILHPILQGPGQEVIMQNAHGRVLSVVRAVTAPGTAKLE